MVTLAEIMPDILKTIQANAEQHEKEQTEDNKKTVAFPVFDHRENNC